MKKLFTISICFIALSSKAQTVTTLAGNGTAGTNDGPFSSALFNNPNGLAVDNKGYLILAEAGSHLIRKLNLTANTVTTIAGSGMGFADGLGTAAKFSTPTNLSCDGARNIYLSDFSNFRIRKIDTIGNVTTFAGTGASGSADGPSLSATFKNPSAVAYSYANNSVYVTDYNNSLIRKIFSGSVTTVSGMAGVGNFNGPVALAKFDHAAALTVDMAGNVIICDRSNNIIRKIDTFGNVTTVAGTTAGYQDGPASSAKFSDPTGVAVDAANNMYICDHGNQRIRKIDPLGNVTTLAGGAQGFADGVGTAAQFSDPASIVLDNTQNYLFVADFTNNRIRKIFLNRTDLGVNSINVPTSISVYPNPSSTKIFLSCYHTEIEKSEIEITNFLGQVVLKTNYSNEINISSLVQGGYFLKIKFSDSSYSYSKFVKE